MPTTNSTHGEHGVGEPEGVGRDAAAATLVATSDAGADDVELHEPAARRGLAASSAMRARLPLAEGIAEASRQHVVGELGHGPLPPGLPHPSAALADRRASCAERVGHGVDGSSGRCTTSPVSPSTTASAAPPLSPATWATPAAAASRNTMPKPSCSRPAQRFRQSMAYTSAQP